jgi:type I restriction enzyme, S subunit
MTQQKTTTHNVPKLRFPEFRNAGAWEEKSLGILSQILRGGSPRLIENFLTIDVDGLNWLKS